jgi:hypothetical protein
MSEWLLKKLKHDNKNIKNNKQKILNKKPTYQISRKRNPCWKNHIFPNPDSEFVTFLGFSPSGLFFFRVYRIEKSNDKVDEEKRMNVVFLI